MPPGGLLRNLFLSELVVFNKCVLPKLVDNWSLTSYRACGQAN